MQNTKFYTYTSNSSSAFLRIHSLVLQQPYATIITKKQYFYRKGHLFMTEFKLTENDQKYNTLMEQLCSLGYEKQLDNMTKGMEIVNLIIQEHLDTTKLTFPYGSFEAFTESAKSGEYDLDDDEEDEVNNPFPQYKTTKDYVKACLHGKITILGIEPDEWETLVKEIQDEESNNRP